MTASRRRTGTGNLTDLGDGRWRMRYTHSGVVHRRNITASSRRAAERELRRWITDIEDGKVRPIDRDATVEAVLREWLARHPKKTEKDKVTCDTFIRLHIGPHLGTIPVAKLTASRIQRFHDDLSVAVSPKTGRPLKASSIVRIHATLSAGLSWAVRQDLIPSNPALNVDPPKVDSPDVGEVETPVVLRLVRAAMAKQPRLGTFAVLAAGTGARRGELCSLRWGDVNWDERILTIDSSVSYLGAKGLIEKGTKNGKSRRVAVDDTVLAVLAVWRAREEASAALRGVELDDGSLVFSNDPQRRRLINPTQLSKDWALLVKEQGEAVRLHDLRHHLASLAVVTHGLPVAVVADQLGHTPRTLMERYTHVTGPVDRRATEAFGAAMRELPQNPPNTSAT